jgi:hypothetical protein
VFGDRLDRIDARAEALRHAPAVGREDHRVDVDVLERNVAGELEPHHDHARDPEVEDLARGREEVGRIEGAQLGRVVGPAEHRERPELRAEPGVEHVDLLPELGVAAAAAARRGLRDVGLLAGVAVPDGQAMAPPELP